MTALSRPSTLSAMAYRLRPYSPFRSVSTPGRQQKLRITHPIAQPTLAFVAEFSSQLFLLHNAQESCGADVSPSLAEPASRSSRIVGRPRSSATPRFISIVIPPQRRACLVAESVVPFAEQHFPSSPEPLSSSTNYTTANECDAPPAAQSLRGMT